ncbi:alpha/beta hydrolase [bacterium]|nr:alpha/beta hydrolase [bacterium]
MLNIYDAHCRMSGEGDAVVIVHPLIPDQFEQNPLVLQLSRQFRIYSITLPGFGPVYPDLPRKPEQFVDFLARLLQNKFLDSFVLVGVSLGARVALRYATQHHMHIRKLILANPAGINTVNPILKLPCIGTLFTSLLSRHLETKAGFQKFIKHLVYNQSLRSGAYFPIQVVQKNSAWAKQAANTIASLGKASVTEKKNYHRIQKPVLLIGSHEDRVVSHATLHDLQGRLQTVDLQFVEKTGHLGIIENPEEYFVKIEQFI